MALKRWSLLWAALALLGLFAVKNRLLDPPAAPTRVAVGQFDTPRALARLSRILGDQRPHSVDTAANDAVRERLIAELRAIGLDPRVQDATDCSDFTKSRTVSCSHVRNVIAVLPGPARPALLLNAHYDSTPTGPGAADDGIGVATMLEVASILKDRPRERPIVLLFNEGEEYGLNGAAAFVARDPQARSIGALINMESRGVRGPASMFETDSPNGRAIADYAASTNRPFANSLTADLAKLIPNTTDVVKFKPAGWETLNFAIVSNETRYHSPGDTVEALSRDSLAHMGSEVLAATERMSGPDRSRNVGTSVYADVAGLLFLTLPQTLALIGVGILVIGAVALTARRRAWSAFGQIALITIFGILVVVVVSAIAGAARPGDFWRAYPDRTYFAIYASLLAALALGARWAADRTDRAQLRIGVWTFTLLLGGWLSAFLPGASIYLLFGPALALIGIAMAPKHKRLGRGLVLAGALLQLLMFAETLAIFEILLIDGPLYAVAPVAALAALPLLLEVGRGAPRSTALILAILAIAGWAAALLAPRASEDRPIGMTLDYVRDDQAGQTAWAIASKQAPLPAALHDQGPWKGEILPYNGRRRWLAEAPLLDIAQPALERVANRAAGKGRIVTLRLATGGADSIALRFDKATPIVAMGLPGQRHAIDATNSEGPFVLRCSGRSCDGLLVEVEIATRKPVRARLVGQQFGAPPQAAPLLAAFPQPSQPQYAPHSRFRIRGYRL